MESAIVFGDAKSPVISDGEADVLVGFEPSETLRALKKSIKIPWWLPILIRSLHFVTIGKGVYPGMDQLQNLIRAKTAKLIAVDAGKLARQAGNPLAVNMVLLGALIQTGKLPIQAAAVRDAI